MPLPFDLTVPAALWMLAVLFGAAFVRGYSGFGFAALVVSGAALVTDPLHFVPVVLIVDIFLTGAQLRSIRGRIDWRRVGFLFAGALAGVPVGLWLLGLVTPDAARMAIALFVLATCLMLWRGWTISRPMGGVAHAGAGVVSGLANAAAVGGLPVALFFAAQGVPAATF
ncbi:MAG: sulfite exporter TauE/SafE family protein, partial [Pseudorhodobacter sp.]